MGRKPVCPICGDVIDDPDSAVYPPIPFYKKYEKLCHEYCVYEDYPAGTLLLYDNGNLYGLRVHNGWADIVYLDDLMRELDYSDEVIRLAKRVRWHPTDGWRGFYELILPRDEARNYHHLDDWCPTLADEYTKHLAEKWEDVYDAFTYLEEIKPEGKAILFVGRTSNVFSVVYDIYIEKNSEVESVFKQYGLL